MHAILATLALLAAPFWESKLPEQWSDEELSRLLHDSPWAQVAVFRSLVGGAGGVQVYLASARPIEEAEEQVRLRNRKRNKPAGTLAGEELDQEYKGFLSSSPGKYIVLAVSFPNAGALADAAEAKKMEEECVLKVGRRKYKIAGHFPPTSFDPYLRLIYRRVVEPSDKEFSFQLYLPSVAAPYREAIFRTKELVYKGKLEM